MSNLPLANIRVLDLTQALAGPFGSMILADLGAEVIKIEPPKGDLTRSTPPHFVGDTSLYFIANNRNKRSVVLDLKLEPHRQAFYDLVRVSDVVFCNFSAGVVERLKVDPATLEAINPRIITCNITGYGRKGPGAMRRAVDLIVQSLAGAMSITGEPGGRPCRAGVATGDLSTGLYALVGILAALNARQSTGRGMRVETSLFHGQLSLLNYLATSSLHSGTVPERVGSGHPGTVPSQTFETADGWLTVDAGFNRQFEILCNVLGLGHLAHDPRFRERPDRSRNRHELLPQISDVLRTRSTVEWIAIMEAQGVPCAPVNNVLEALRDPQSETYGAVRDIDHHGTGIPVLTTPIWFDDQVGHPLNPAPDLGEHTEEVLRRVAGYDESRLGALRAAGPEVASEQKGRA